MFHISLQGIVESFRDLQKMKGIGEYHMALKSIAKHFEASQSIVEGCRELQAVAKCHRA